MQIDAVSFLPAVQMPSLAPSGESVPAQAVASTFAGQFEQNMNEVNASLLQADQATQRLAAGDAGNLHDVMIKLQEARLSLQLMLQVRNHLLDAYHEISQMQL